MYPSSGVTVSDYGFRERSTNDLANWPKGPDQKKGPSCFWKSYLSGWKSFSAMSLLDRPIAMVCASNQNRSVEAHFSLINSGFRNVSSYGK
jgi:hypothetical protein